MIEILALILKIRKYVSKATFRTIDNGECNKINPNFTVNYDINAFNNYKNTLKIIIKYYFLMCKK